MGKRFVLAVGLVLCASLAMANSVRVKASKANVRSEPSVSASVVGTVAQGKTLVVIVTVADWIKVTDGSSTGWIHKSLVEPVADARAPSAAAETAAPAASTSAAGETRRSAPAQHASSSEKKKIISFGLGGSFATHSIGFGLHGRATVRPTEALPPLRGVVEFDYFLKSGMGWRGTVNAAYVLGKPKDEFQPYLGGGLVFARVAGQTGTDFDLAAGVERRERLFLEGRIVFSSETVLIVSAGIKF
jgi:hypothetical protein